ncbi:integration host factor, actinobacterial type [Nesterenkonia sphaerica]|uniref:DNA-binding protein n=1 Tax=Nesterenkonia sphaerica TaxID=1804988 RepID=A0A5R9ANJ7_9MICC|nr:integration host factor, actinobacterial type [Nesterenkonia sphaerica]TLP79407.1 DNA-binding protein [Nesterenkonia sphaerica]
MALRELTQQERDTARQKALAARAERAEVKRGFGAGALSFTQVLERADSSEAIARLKTIELLEALPGVGRVTATKILEDHGVSVTRRLGGLGVKQRRALTEHLAELS